MQPCFVACGAQGRRVAYGRRGQSRRREVGQESRASKSTSHSVQIELDSIELRVLGWRAGVHHGLPMLSDNRELLSFRVSKEEGAGQGETNRTPFHTTKKTPKSIANTRKTTPRHSFLNRFCFLPLSWRACPILSLNFVYYDLLTPRKCKAQHTVILFDKHPTRPY